MDSGKYISTRIPRCKANQFRTESSIHELFFEQLLVLGAVTCVMRPINRASPGHEIPFSSAKEI
jgi:hypothetical protein